MNNRLFKYLTTFLLIVSCSAAVQSNGQNFNVSVNKGTNDSLELNKIIKVVLDQHPSIQEAQEAIKAADVKIALAKTAYQPTLEGNASFTRIGPAPSFDIPNLGKLSLVPANNYSTTIDITKVSMILAKPPAR